jgi:hypothetical protein
MHPVIALALVMVAGVAAIRLPRFPSLPPVLALTGAAGTALLMLGVLFGPLSDVLDDATLTVLTPVLALAIGWVGARFGARFERRWLRRVPRDIWMLAGVQAVAAVVGVALVTAALVVVVPGLRARWPAPRAATILALAALAAVSAPDLVTLAARRADVGPRRARRFRAAAILDSAGGMLLFALVLGGRRFGLLGGLPIALGAGVVVGLLVSWLHRLLGRGDLTVTLLGACLLGAGAGVAAGVPAFFVCAVAAATAMWFSPLRRPMASRLAGWERALCAVLLFLTGALLRVPWLWVIPMGVALAAVRAAARWAAVRYGATPLRALQPLGREAGLASVAAGGIPLALAAGWHLARPGAASAAVLTVTAIAAACGQLAAPACMARAARPREL